MYNQFLFAVVPRYAAKGKLACGKRMCSLTELRSLNTFVKICYKPVFKRCNRMVLVRNQPVDAFEMEINVELVKIFVQNIS